MNRAAEVKRLAGGQSEAGRLLLAQSEQCGARAEVGADGSVGHGKRLGVAGRGAGRKREVVDVSWPGDVAGAVERAVPERSEVLVAVYGDSALKVANRADEAEVVCAAPFGVLGVADELEQKLFLGSGRVLRRRFYLSQTATDCLLDCPAEKDHYASSIGPKEVAMRAYDTGEELCCNRGRLPAPIWNLFKKDENRG